MKSSFDPKHDIGKSNVIYGKSSKIRKCSNVCWDGRLHLRTRIANSLDIRNKALLVRYSKGVNETYDVVPIYFETGSCSIPLPKNVALKLDANYNDIIRYEILKAKDFTSNGKIKTIKNPIFSANGSKYIDMLSIAPRKMTTETTNRKYPVDLIDFNYPNNKITFWYKPKKGGTPKILTLPRKIPLNKEIARTFGLFQGELCKTQKASIFSFSNCNPENINEIIKFFENALKLERNELTYQIGYTGKRIVNISKNLKSFWKNRFNIKLNNDIRFYRHINADACSPVGTLHMYKSSIILKEIILSILNHLKKEIFNGKELLYGFIQGLMTAEGWPKLADGFINSISIGLSGKKMKTDGVFYKRLFKSIDVVAKNVNKNDLEITDWNNFYKLAQIDIFKTYPERKIIFLEGLLRHPCTIVLRNVSKLNKEIVFPKQFSRIINLHSVSIGRSLNNLDKYGFLKIKRCPKPTKYLIKITSKGKSAIKLFNILEKELKNEYKHIEGLNKKLCNLSLGQLKLSLEKRKIKTIYP